MINFQHDIRDVIPFSEFVVNVRSQLSSNQLGEYLGDDMAIDGGDAEAIFSCKSSKRLYEFLKSGLSDLTFLKGAKVTLVFGELDSNSLKEEIII